MSSIFKLTQQWAKKNKLSYWQKEETTSTNNQAKEEAFTVGEFKLYLCDKQTQGRGRGSNLWHTGRSGAYFLSTWAFTLGAAPQPTASPLVGLALFESAQKAWSNLEWSLKAPNDLYLKGKKIAGLLIENIQQGDKHLMAVGLGMNVLANPENIKNSTYITGSDGTGDFFDEKKWFLFLTNFYNKLSKAVKQSSHGLINMKEREALLLALNANSTKKEIFVEVTDQATLITKTSSFNWENI